jgi:hypothetical protein
MLQRSATVLPIPLGSEFTQVLNVLEIFSQI